MRFAREQPQIFALTMMRCTEGEKDPAHVELWQFVLGQVGRLYSDERAPEAGVTLWAFLHGMTALEAAGVFGQRKPFSSFDFGLEMWIKAAKVEIP
ncbi:MAG: WHG domain-containing protein [Bryobacteraceae bacterium]|nr:WHG domain-containing protein [Bryobacteraceae bacterium]